MTPIQAVTYAAAASLASLTLPRELGWTLAPDLFALGTAAACLPQASRRERSHTQDAWRTPIWAFTTGLARDLTLGLPLGCSALAFVAVACVLHRVWSELATSLPVAAICSALLLDLSGRAAELACSSSQPDWPLLTRALWLTTATTATAALISLLMPSLGIGLHLGRPVAGRRRS